MTNLISVSFPANDRAAAKHLGAALTAIGGGAPTVAPVAGADIELGDAVVVSGTTTDNDGAGAVTKVDKTAAGGEAEQPAQVDTKKVPFNAEFCGNAAKPFYASGPRNGQWKKRQGVDDAAYDAWYTEQTALLLAQTAGGDDDEPVNTAGAFGTGDDSGAAQAEPAPTDCGGFMGWVSAQQAANLLTQDDIGEAYKAVGVAVTDLFPPNDEATVAGHVAKLYQFLLAKVGA